MGSTPKKPTMVKAASAKKPVKKAAKDTTKKKSVGGKKEKAPKKTGPYTQWKGESIPMVKVSRNKTHTGNDFTAVCWN
eukprot:gene687-577_t